MVYRPYLNCWLAMALLSCAPLPSLVHDTQVQPLIDLCEYKAAIKVYEDLIQKAHPEELSSLQERLAMLYERDQDQEKAFHLFLQALDNAPKKDIPQMSSEEQLLYDKALVLYLDQTSISIQSTAEQIKQQYGPAIAEHPDYSHLKLIVALAEANLGLLQDFFLHFYEAFAFLSDHHLSYKAKTILHIKLFDRARTKEGKEQQRRKIRQLAEQAIDRFPNDSSLYRIAIAFTAEEDRQQAIVKYFSQIIAQNIPIPRCDILFYVKQAVAVKEFKLAQRLIDKAQEWYHYSKAIEQAKDYIKVNIYGTESSG